MNFAKSAILCGILAWSGIGVSGCSSDLNMSSKQHPVTDTAQRGNSGQSPETAGARDVPIVKQPLTPDEKTRFQGGNGAFGESPEKPGGVSPFGKTPAGDGNRSQRDNGESSPAPVEK